MVYALGILPIIKIALQKVLVRLQRATCTERLATICHTVNNFADSPLSG